MEDSARFSSARPARLVSTFVTIGSCLLILGCSGRGQRGATYVQPGEGSLIAAQRLDSVDEALFSGPDEELVRVNGAPITRREFLARALRQLGSMTLLSEVVKEELFLQEARRKGIEVTQDDLDREVEAEVEGRSRQLGEGDPAVGRERLADLYEQQGMSLSAVRRDLRRRARNQLIISRVTRSMREANNETLRSFYEQNRRFWTRHIAYRFTTPAQNPSANHAKEKADALEKSKRAIGALRHGTAEFAALAMAESDDEMTRGFGGNLGPITVDAPMPPELKRAVFALKEGEISEPVENPAGGYHVFQVTKIRPKEPFEQIVEQLREEYLGREPDLREIRQAFYRLRRESSIRWATAKDG